ncbi:unnamed protein product [Moneuplotes crassus]|uniref:Acid phosphatase n=1 Tax=Euplotes crassus TaxID=5936 RepID=A0AAD1XFD4_EUPCR|nr:unnamed protein product [Moneuplotes crassus]
MKQLLWCALFIAHCLCKLELVVEVFRHGARSPMNITYPTSFGANWEIGGGQLTSSGERQHYLLGLKRRNKYIYDEGFLPNNYSPGTIYAESTDYNRTSMSAYAHLLGMYPLENRENFQIMLPNGTFTVHHPIPVHMRGDDQGVLNGHNTDYCHASQVIEQESRNKANEEFTNSHSIQQMIKEVNEKLGDAKYVNFTDIENAVDSYYSLYYNNKSHSIQMSDYFVSKMDHYLWLRMNHMIHRDDFGVRIASHSFFGILNSLISHRTGLNNSIPETNVTNSIPKEALYYIFSGHDNTIVAILAGLGLKTEGFPEYGASITIELHKEDGKYYLIFLYNDKYLNVNNICSAYEHKCNPVLILNFLKSRMLTQSYQEVCDHFKRKAEEALKQDSENFWILIKVLFFIILIVFVVVGCAYWTYRKNRPRTGREILEQEMERFDREFQFDSHRPEII